MFKALLLMFRRNLIKDIIIKLYNVTYTMKTFLLFILEKHEKEESTSEEIAGISIGRISSLIRILTISSNILEKGAQYLLGIDLTIHKSGLDPLDEDSLKDLEKDLENQLKSVEETTGVK